MRLLRTLLITSAVFGVSGIVSGILNAHQHFLIPALASSMYWLGWIIGLVFFVHAVGIMGWPGAPCWAPSDLSIQLPDLFRLPGRVYSYAGVKNPPSVRWPC